MMYRRIVTSLIAVLVVFAMAVPVAAARLSHQDLVNQRLGEVGAWAMPTAKSGEPLLTSKRGLIRERLGEVGAWAVPATEQGEPSLAGRRALVRQRLEEIGAWAVPSTSTTPQVASSGAGLDWQDLGIGTAFAVGALLLGVWGVVSIRRHHRPIAH